MLDLSGPPPPGHLLADVWDYLQWLEANRAARRPPPGFPEFLWGARPVIGSQPEKFFAGRVDQAFADLWSMAAPDERVDFVQRLMKLGVRSGQLMAVTGENERFFRGVQAVFRIQQRRGPVPTARQVFRRWGTSSHATSLMDCYRHRFYAPSCRSLLFIVRNFELSVLEYRGVVTVAPSKLDAADAWTVLWAFMRDEIELRACDDVLQLYWAFREQSTRSSPLLIAPENGVTAADRVRFFLQYAVVAPPV